MRLIDADALETHEMLVPLGNGQYEYTEVVYKDDIDIMPTIEPEQKKGEWVKIIKHYKDDNMEFDFYAIKCSACGEKPEKAYHLTRYCPNCGADMRGDTE